MEEVACPCRSQFEVTCGCFAISECGGCEEEAASNVHAPLRTRIIVSGFFCSLERGNNPRMFDAAFSDEQQTPLKLHKSRLIGVYMPCTGNPQPFKHSPAASSVNLAPVKASLDRIIPPRQRRACFRTRRLAGAEYRTLDDKLLVHNSTTAPAAQSMSLAWGEPSA